MSLAFFFNRCFVILIFFRLKFFWSLILLACFVVPGSGAHGSHYLDDSSEEDERSCTSLTRQCFIKNQAEVLQQLLKIYPVREKRAKTENVVATLEFNSPFNFLNREGVFLSVLQEETGNKKLEKAKQLILKKERELNDKDHRKGKLIFYFKILFWNGLTEQKENPFLIKHDWHKTAYQNLLA